MLNCCMMLLEEKPVEDDAYEYEYEYESFIYYIHTYI